MVGHTGGTAATRRIRRLKTPRPVEVEAAEDGSPLRVRLGEWRDVTLARRPWRVDQHWWRGAPVRRDYFRVAPDDGRPAMTIYRDAVSGQWFGQEYG